MRWYCGIDGGQPRCSIKESLSEVGLKGFEDVPCHYLSAGQLRRVALARLFLTPSPLWVLDEPFTAIDKKGVSNLESLMQEHVNGGGAVILTTHQDLSIPSIKKLDLNQFKPVTEV